MTATEARAVARSAAYQALLDDDSRTVPATYRIDSPMGPGALRVPVERYVSPAFHQLEVQKLWKHVWQMACREEQLPEVGDHVNYEIAGIEIIVVRSAPGVLKAYRNVCLHRGRQLKEFDGRDEELRCSFHGIAWNLDGTLKQLPCKWDFPHVEAETWSLPEAQVGTWGGFVFVNPDLDAAPLAEHLEGLTEQFVDWPLEERYQEAHVGKVLRCNWKLAQEAFMESYHVVATHPQLLAGMGDTISQYDAFKNFARAFTPNGVTSEHLRWQPTEQDMIDALTDRGLDEPEPRMTVPEGATARRFLADVRRGNLVPQLGQERADALSDAEMNDSLVYAVFPNFHPWGSYNRIVYRFRPWKNRHDRCLMECMILSPFAGERPPPARFHFLDEDDDWTEAHELGLLSRVFNQDVYNLPKVQVGLESGSLENVTFAEYQETKIRLHHVLLEEWLSRD